ncbi:ankyrin repeat domain-containing protein [Aspergillus affinis]|uniref:ankyrin repeat domain-containing protein n=1 Tax=Aspergillus affinis TaxID=1070780 RepID=UPI0022FDBEEF|nr:uncharacterized protein KD926_004607 [Aspergillus affinis]KAI9043104.1 hypothetical protein KD926_004607 [Aspergillus affinis]
MTVTLLDLPNELLLYIARFLPSQEDVSYLCCANRLLHAVLDSYLYHFNVHHDNAFALTFGAHVGCRTVVVKCLAAKPPNIDAPPYRLPGRSRGWPSRNALCNAIIRQHTDLVELLLAHGASPHHGWRGKVTPLMMAAKYGNIESMRMLIERGADAHAKDGLQQTALYYAAARGGVEFIRFLLEQGAEVNVAGENGKTPFLLAAGAGDLASMEVLLDHGVDIAAIDASGRNALCAAAKSGQVPCVQSLLDRGAECQLSTDMGRTALFDAVHYGQAEVAQLLLDRGVILERKEELMHATARSGYLACLEILLRHGVDVDCKTQNQETPLLLAVRFGHSNVVEHLVGVGADINSPELKGQTPMSLAHARVDKRIELLLRGETIQCRPP